MRKLATIAFSFAAAVFAAVLLPWNGWQLWAGEICASGGIAAVVLRRKKWALRAALITFSMAAALLYCTGYDALVAAPVRQHCGDTDTFRGTVCGWPQETEYGAKVMLRPEGYPFVKIVYYGDESLLSLVPGNVLSGTARWQDASRIQEEDVTTFTARSVYALLYGEGEVTVSEGNTQSLRYLPLRLNHRLGTVIGAIWSDSEIAGMNKAMLLGDRSDLPASTYKTMQEVGLAHLFAVSGLHCAFLASMVLFFVPAGFRRLGAAVTIGALLFYACMVGLTPSVVRACVMQIFLLTAPLLRRDSDGYTALGGALLVILLCNPFAAASVSLQLSFGATLGMIRFSPRLYRTAESACRKWFRRVYPAVKFLLANTACCCGALVCIVPLSAYYFSTLSLVAPVAGILTVSAASWSFVAAFLAALAGLLWLPLGKCLGIVSFGLLCYVRLVARLLVQIPCHAVFFENHYLRRWIWFIYSGFLLCWVTRSQKRTYLICAALSVVTLCAALWLNRAEFHYGEMNVLAFDVGQGQSVALYAGQDALLVDCGSSNGSVEAGREVADGLRAIGIHRLQAVVVTHYHADHTNGLYDLLRTIPVKTLYLPDIEDEYGVRERLMALAEETGAAVVLLHEETEIAVGTMAVTLFPPMAEGDLNESCLAVLCSEGNFDTLITGDMPMDTEQALIEAYPIPDIEVLLVGHHGSASSSGEAFLRAVSPEVAIISVGENNYGHPTPEAMMRLSLQGAEIYRTDERGDVRVAVNGG